MISRLKIIAETIGDDLEIENNVNNNELTAIPVFTALTRIDGRLNISRNAVLATVSGFGSLSHIGTEESFFSGISIISNAVLGSVSGFGSLETIEGDFGIRSNGALSSVSGFGSVQTIEGDFEIERNGALASVSGFGSLTRIQRELSIGNNVKLTRVTGFTNLRRIGADNFGTNSGGIFIEGNDVLTTLPSFSALTNIDFSLRIEDNDVLTTLPTFDALTEIGFDLDIRNNAALTSVSGFGSLEEIGDYLRIDNNDNLTTISGFGSLATIGDDFGSPFREYLLIENNASLVTFSGFGSLTSVTGDYTLADNAQLSSCCGLLRLADGTVVPEGTVKISGNATGCNGTSGIAVACVFTRTLAASSLTPNVTAAAGRVTFDVTANVPWSISQASPVSWISSISPETGNANRQITIVYTENTAITTRDAVLTLSATDEGGTERVEITLTQAAAARALSADKPRIPVAAAAGRVTFNITSNVPWRITKRVADTFITTISPETGNANRQITIEYAENTAITPRDAILTLAATGGGSETVAITLTQAAAARALSADNTVYPSPPLPEGLLSISRRMCLGELPKGSRILLLPPFRPKRETLINKLPSHTMKIPQSHPEMPFLHSLRPVEGAKRWPLPSRKRQRHEHSLPIRPVYPSSQTKEVLLSM